MCTYDTMDGISAGESYSDILFGTALTSKVHEQSIASDPKGVSDSLPPA